MPAQLPLKMELLTPVGYVGLFVAALAAEWPTETTRWVQHGQPGTWGDATPGGFLRAPKMHPFSFQKLSRVKPVQKLDGRPMLDQHT